MKRTIDLNRGLDWLLERLSERSTWDGILLTAVHFMGSHMSPETMQNLEGPLSLIAGLLLVTTNENKTPPQ